MATIFGVTAEVRFCLGQALGRNQIAVGTIEGASQAPRELGNTQKSYLGSAGISRVPIILSDSM